MADSLAKDYPIGLYNGFVGYTGLLPRSLSISEADSFAPRVTSTKGETDLDGTLHYTFPVDHGFTKQLTDDNKNFRVTGNYNPVDNNLYPQLPLVTGSTVSGQTWTAKCTTHHQTFVATNNSQSGFNTLHSLSGGTATAITLPSAIATSPIPITTIVYWQKYLFIAGQNTNGSGFNIHRYNLDTATWQDVSGTASLLFTLRDGLYHMNGTSFRLFIGSNLEAAASATWTLVKAVGPISKNSDVLYTAIEWNGAAWISKESGLYRFDGVDVVRVLDIPIHNMTAHNGALYFESSGWLCRFTGSLIERVQYFGGAESIQDMNSFNNNLYILAGYDNVTFKYGSDGGTGSRIFEHDGLNFRVFKDLPSGYTYHFITDHGNSLIVTRTDSVPALSLAYLDTSSSYSATTTEEQASVITADFDAELPNINKLLRRVQVDLTNPLAADTVTVKFQAYSSGSWGGLWTLGTLTDLDDPTSTNVLLAPKASLVNVYDFERIRLHVTLNPSVGSSVSLTSVTLHYTLHPYPRRRISVTVPVINGTDSHHAISQLDGELVYPTPSTLTSRLYAYSNLISYSDSFTWLIGPESWDVRTAITTGSTSVQVKGQLTIYDSPGNYNYLPTFALLDTDQGNLELVRAHSSIYDQTNDYTTLTFDARGAFGTTAVAATTSYVLMPAIQLSRMRLISQHIIPDQTTFATDANGTRQIERDITYELTEL